MEFPDPVIEVAVEPKTKADQEKMAQALGKLAAEDPSSASRRDEESGQTIIKGMGELHLEIIVDRMKREFKVEANVGAPQVAYREAHPKRGRNRLHAQEADRWFRPVRAVSDRRSSNTEPGNGFEFVKQDRRRSRSAEYIPASRRASRTAMKQNGIWPASRSSTSRRR